MCPEISVPAWFVRALVLVAIVMPLATPASAQSATGGYHSLVVKSDGTVWSFGYNGVGSLGDGTTTDRSSPVQVSGLTDIVGVAAGEYHSMAITSTGSLYVWGYNNKANLYGIFMAFRIWRWCEDLCSCIPITRTN